MSPPAWIRAESTRLDLDGFQTTFAESWRRLESRFLKLECWQSYEELDPDGSQRAYRRGDLDQACELLEREADADRPLYDEVRRRGLEYARVRLVRRPFTDYLEYELLSYRIRQALGEVIEIVDLPADVPLPNETYFDFLLFDRHTALIHDYGTGDTGRQTGGWLTRSQRVTRALEQTLTALRREAIPFSAELSQLPGR